MFSPEKSDGKPLAFVLSNGNLGQTKESLASGTLVFGNKEAIIEAAKKGLIPQEWEKGLIEVNNLSKNPVIVPEGAVKAWQEQQQGLK